MIRLKLTSPEETKAIASRVATALGSGDIVLLSGDLGTGKTTFTQGLGAGLGITDQIVSPTFILMRSYKGRLTLHHVDVYRLDQLQEIVELGLGETVDEGGVAVIEWGEKAAPIFPSDYLTIRITYGDGDDERLMEIEAVGDSWTSRVAALEGSLADWVAA